MNRILLSVMVLLSPLLLGGLSVNQTPNEGSPVHVKVPFGFHTTLVANGLGEARHIAVNAKGNLYVKLNDLNDGSGILYLTLDREGKVQKTQKFCHYKGTGMAIKDGYLYASSDEAVFRYKLDADGNVLDTEKPEEIVTGLLNRHEHTSKSITLDNDGHIYVNVGAYSNSCQLKDREKGSQGMNPCPILDSAGGIWRFQNNVPHQTYHEGIRYGTGIRNVVGLDWNSQTNQLFVMMHGRDQLHDLYPQYYSAKKSAVLPAEAMYEINKGDDCGWPYMYYDWMLKKKILSPEYGGDGVKEATKKAKDPLVAFPGHMAPNGLLFYTGKAFPEKYRNGAFVAFHGSWNRAPEPQAGYFVVFVPFKNGIPSGKWEVFADGFSGKSQVNSPDDALHRPCGLAQGPDGALYVSDDAGGSIFKIAYTGK